MEVMFLCWLTRYTQKPIHELFDHIIATSTGALISVGLATPKKFSLPKPKFNAPDTGILAFFHKEPPQSPYYTPDDILVLYEHKSKEIFSGRDFIGRYPYPDKNFNDIIQKLFQLPNQSTQQNAQEGGAENSSPPLFDFIQAPGHKSTDLQISDNAELTMRDLGMSISITAYDMQQGERFVVSRQNAFKTPDKNYRVWEVVRTAAAAPTIFKPTNMLKTGIPTCDAGIVCNNPSFLGMIEAAKAHKTKPHKVILLSLGGGRLINTLSFDQLCALENYAAWGPNTLTSVILSRSFDGHNQHLDLLKMLKLYYTPDDLMSHYLRISPQLSSECFTTDGKDAAFFEALEKVAYKEIEHLETGLVHFANVLSRGTPAPPPVSTHVSSPTPSAAGTPEGTRWHSEPLDIRYEVLQ